MKNIIIFEQSSTIAGTYGIGTFVKILQNFFNPSEFQVYLVETSSTDEELEIIKLKSITKILIPADGNICMHLLSLYIDTIENSIVFFNYNRQFSAVKKIKQKYVNIQLFGVFHSFSWLWTIHGKEQLLNKYMNQKHPSDLIRKIQVTINKEKENIKYLDKLITLSNDSLKILNKIYNVENTKLYCIPNGIKDSFNDNFSKSSLKDEMLLRNDEKIILYVGRLDLLKGIDTLIMSFNKLLNSYKNCRLVFVGDGRFDMISNHLGKAASRIIFTGRISQNELKKWYKIADIAVLPSLSEECSFVGIEMLMHGLPIITTNARGVRNMFHNMENSLTVNCRGSKSQFEEELYEAMLRLLTDDELLNNLRKKSRQWYLNHYRVEQMKERYLSLVKELI